MDKSSAAVYIYAKASGMLASSFIKKRTAELFSFQSLSSLWTAVLGTEVPLMPENLLARHFEDSARNRFLSDFMSLVDCYDSPDDLFVTLLRSNDYSNIKEIAAALIQKTAVPPLADIKHYSMLKYTALPNFSAVTAGSPIEWYSSPADITGQSSIDTRLDIQYTRSLWQAACKVPIAERKIVSDFILEQIILQNCIWAVRLRVYFRMNREQITPLLVFSSDENAADDIFASEALSILDFQTDIFDDWKKWKYVNLLNRFDDGTMWSADPRWLEQSVKLYFVKKAHRMFRTHPFTDAALLAWYTVKLYELDCIRTAAEGIKLSARPEEMRVSSGIEPNR